MTFIGHRWVVKDSEKTSIQTADFKAHLSRYIRDVRQGKPLTLLDRKSRSRRLWDLKPFGFDLPRTGFVPGVRGYPPPGLALKALKLDESLGKKDNGQTLGRLASKERWTIVVTEQKIRQMAKAIVREVHPERILLFGSRARGTAGPASDVDLVIIEKKPFGPCRSRGREMARLWETLSKFDFPKDILVYSQEEFDYWSDSLNHVVGRAVREGRTLYERS